MTLRLALLAAAACLATVPATAADLVIHAGRLIDGSGAAPQSKVSILVHDDRITAVKPGFVEGTAGARVIDLSNATVLPGLIDMHVHMLMTFHKGDPIHYATTHTAYDDLIDGVNDARATLMAGFTAVRDVGDDTTAIVALKRAIEGGAVPGPRMWVAGQALGPTGGHGDAANGMRPDIAELPHMHDNVIDSPEEARAAVRRLKREGADLVKIMPSGGVMSIGDDPKRQLMEDDEIKAVIDTAHALGMRVAAHAHGKDAIDHTIALGVDSIEHGTYADAASYKAFKAHDTWFVPTMLVGNAVYEHAKAHPEDLNPSAAAKALMVVPVMQANLRAARAAGVKIAFGTDTFGLTLHGQNAGEFPLYVQAGMSPMEAILTATKNAAELMGSDDIGQIKPGRYADIIAVTSDPLANVTALGNVDFVMKGGAVVKSGGKPTA
jgi:imidazolonepropionase-like amidohydrolase